MIQTMRVGLVLFVLTSHGPLSAHPNDPTSEEMAERDRFVAATLLGVQVPEAPQAVVEVPPDESGIVHGTSGHGLRKNKMWDDRPLRLGSRYYFSGLSIHANARLIVQLPAPGLHLKHRNHSSQVP